MDALYSMACICAIASKDEHHREEYAAQAVALLRHAVRRGFTDGKVIRGDADFRPLLARADFQAVLADPALEPKPASAGAQKSGP